jgi:mannosyltransferase
MSEAAAQSNAESAGRGGARILFAPLSGVLVLSEIVLFAAVIRFWDLAGPSLWLDELFSVSFAGLPQHQLWSDWMRRETNPPLYYSLLHEWMSVFGRGEFALRGLSVLFGTAAVPVMYLIGRRVYSHEAGLATALLTAVSSHHLQFSQVARGYALGFLAAALAIYALLRLTDAWVERRRSGRGGVLDLGLYALAVSVAVYTHTTFVLLPCLASLYVAWLWWARAGRSVAMLVGWVAANLVVLMICAWWLFITYQQVTAEGGAAAISWIEPPTAKSALLKIKLLFFTRQLGVGDYLIAALFAAMTAWGLSRMTLERRVLLLTMFVGLPLLLLLLSLKQPIYLERTLLWAQAAYIPALATGAVALPARRLAIAAALGVAVVWFVDALAVQKRHHYREPWRDIATVLDARADADDVLLAGSGSALVNFDYYCQDGCGDIRRLAVKRPQDIEVLREYFRGREIGPADVRSALKGVDRIWVIHRGRGQKIEQLLSGLAVQEDRDVLRSDPLTQGRPVHAGDMRLSRWAVIASE